MKHFPTFLIIVSSLITMVPAARSQFSYDFDGTTTTHFGYQTEGIGELTDSTARNTYYTSGSATGEDAAALSYNTTFALNSDWTVSLTFTAPNNISGVPSLGSSESVDIGLSATRTGAAEGAFLDMQMQIFNDDGNGANDREFSAEYNDGFGGGADDSSTTATSLTSATLKLVYDYTAGADTGILTAWYDSTQLGGDYDLLNGTTGWDADADTDTASIYIFMSSDGIDEFNTNQPTFDNFSVTAVPEPSTTVAIVGLFVLGLAVYQRRVC